MGVLRLSHLHLDEKLRFDPPRRLALIAFSALATQRINFIDEDDGRCIFTSHFEQVCDQLSLSPIHLERRSDEDILKKVESASVATAFAK